eukprot:COSAG03_NODE_17505_length_378_cov_0.741818_1_plen_25_part_10
MLRDQPPPGTENSRGRPRRRERRGG